MQRPPLLELNGFCFWKSRFKTYAKSKDIDLCQVIQNGDFYYEVEDSETKLIKEMPYELLEDDQKKKIGKNNEANMTLYNALPRKEYERVFMCKTAKEKINSDFTRFNAIVTSLKSLDPDYSSKNHVRQFLHALPLKWRAMVYEMVLDNDGVASRTTTKEKVKSLALKAKVTREQTSDDSDSQDGNDEEVDKCFHNWYQSLVALDLGSTRCIDVESMKEEWYGRKEHFILPRGRISTAGYEVSTASFILSTAYEYLVSAAAYSNCSRIDHLELGLVWNDNEEKPCLIIYCSLDSAANFRKGNRFGNGGNRFKKGRRNNFGNKGGESSKPKGACYNCGIEGHFASECRKPKENKAFVGGAWSDIENGDEQLNDATCLMAIDFQELVSKPSKKRALEYENSKLLSKINDLELEVKKLLNNKEVVEPCQKCVELTQEVDPLKCNASKLQDEALNFPKFKSSSIALDDMLSRQKLSQDKEGYSQTSKAYIVLNKETMRIKESLNVTLDESLPKPKSSSLIEDDRIDEPIVQDLNGSPSLQFNVSDEGYPKSLKDARGHPIKQVIGGLNEGTLRSKSKQA
ncbi:zf-CCHC domain-containing protein [Tanacetum coccineum]